MVLSIMDKSRLDDPEFKAAVKRELTTLDQALLDGRLLPNGQTVGQWAEPQLERFALEGRMPPLLPGSTE